MHTTDKELVVYLYGRILSGLDANHLLKRWVKVMDVTVSEEIGQEAAFHHAIPWQPWQPRDDAAAWGEGGEEDLFVPSYMSRGKIPAMPCTMDTKGARTRRRGKKKLQSTARGGAGSA
jgi:hypothetical protein